MSEELHLVKDLAIILISAGLFTIISRILKQPLVLGYIIAGFLVGPHITFFPSITSVDTVNEWSEIGIIFMMFALGLEFSIKKMLKVGSTALIVAGGKFIGIFATGFLIGRALSWTSMESIFLAGLLSMSSTAVVIKAYDDMGLKNKSYSQLVFGTLVVEDIIAIVLMVLLSTLAVSNNFSGIEMISGFLKLAFFLILSFLVGIYIIPTVFRRVSQYINDEILLIVSIGLCFGMVALASSVGFSSALGAFIMGSILAETVEGERIEHLVKGIKELFSAIFFVSVGMMLDPHVIGKYWFIILLLTIVVIVTHAFFAGISVILSGKGLHNAVKVGFSLSQLGEFGFIIAGVGVSLGVMRDFIYPVIIAVSVITTFATPYIIKSSDKAYDWLIANLHPALLERIEEKNDNSTAEEKSEWRILIKAYATRIILYSVLIIAVLIASESIINPLFLKLLSFMNATVVKIITVAVTLAIMSPLLYGLTINTRGDVNRSAIHLLQENKANFLPLLGLILLRFFLAISYVIVLISNHFELQGWSIFIIISGGAAFLFFARRFMKKHTALEDHFMRNLNAKENFENSK